MKKCGIEKGKKIVIMPIVKKLLEFGISEEQVIEATGVTKEEIEKIKKSDNVK